MTSPYKQVESAGLQGDVASIRSLFILYGVFFLIWLLSLVLGELLPEDSLPALWGMPFWFVLGCLISYVAVCAGLIFCVRRYYR